MDSYCEYIVKKRNGGKELGLRALIIVAAIALFIIFMMLGFVMPNFSMITILLAAGSLYGGYILITNMSVEYEYIVTNGEMDIDKIIAKRRRKRLITVNARTFERFGPFKESDHAGETYSFEEFVANDKRDAGAVTRSADTYVDSRTLHGFQMPPKIHKGSPLQRNRR